MLTDGGWSRSWFRRLRGRSTSVSTGESDLTTVMQQDEYLARLQELYEECRCGVGAAAVVDGGVGSGKTTLLHTFKKWAKAKGATVLSAIGSRSEGALPLGVVRQLY